MIHWAEQFLGIPWKTGGRDVRSGLDCWGLLRHVYATHHGIQLDTHANVNIECVMSFRALLDELSTGLWHEVDVPEDGDGVALGRNGCFHHVGVYVGDNSVLHTEKNSGAHIENIKHLRANGLDTISFYRYGHSS